MREWVGEGQRKRGIDDLKQVPCWQQKADGGLEFTNRKIMTWDKVRCLTHWVTQEPHDHVLILLSDLCITHKSISRASNSFEDITWIYSNISGVLFYFLAGDLAHRTQILSAPIWIGYPLSLKHSSHLRTHHPGNPFCFSFVLHLHFLGSRFFSSEFSPSFSCVDLPGVP